MFLHYSSFEKYPKPAELVSVEWQIMIESPQKACLGTVCKELENIVLARIRRGLF